MAIQKFFRLNRNYKTDLNLLTGRRIVELANKISVLQFIPPTLTNTLFQIDYKDKKLSGTLQQVQNDLLEVEENGIFDYAYFNFQINENPLKTLRYDIYGQILQVSIESKNFQQQEFEEILRLTEETFPISQEIEQPQSQRSTQTISTTQVEQKKEQENRRIPTKDVFVIMSFNDEYRDAYFVAIQPTLKKLGFNPVRVDEIQHNNTVTKEIYEAIDRSSFVVADLTGERPNVYYEVGWAHRAEKEVVLLAKKGTAVHFDVTAINRIDYKDFTDLCDGLEKRVKAVAIRLGIEIEKK